MENSLVSLTIGAFARIAGVNVETIRYYQRRGLLLEPERRFGGIRRYGDADVARLTFVKSAQRTGFTLDEVATLLKLQDGAHCSEAREIAEHKLTDVRQRLADLKQIEHALSALVGRCRTSKGTVTCPLIASLQKPHRSNRRATAGRA
jgi:MerR family mercuric resistance operon transcriptional regulator